MDDLLLYFDCGMSSKCPARISQHTVTPLTKVAILHGANILVKSLLVLIAH